MEENRGRAKGGPRGANENEENDGDGTNGLKEDGEKLSRKLNPT